MRKGENDPSRIKAEAELSIYREKGYSASDFIREFFEEEIDEEEDDMDEMNLKTLWRKNKLALRRLEKIAKTLKMEQYDFVKDQMKRLPTK